MGRAPCCDKVGLKKGPWTADEDQKLTAYIQEHGHGSWRALPKKAGLLRCGKSCRLRWTNYLRPDIKRGEFSASEEQSIIQLHALLGNRWSAIATHLPKRTDNEIKNYWNTHLKKRLIKMGIDPVTHKPCGGGGASESGGGGGGGITTSNNSGGGGNALGSSSSNGGGGGSHMAQWESVRREAEARLAKEAEMRAKGLWPSTTTTATGGGTSTIISGTTTSATASDMLSPNPPSPFFSTSSSSESGNPMDLLHVHSIDPCRLLPFSSSWYSNNPYNSTGACDDGGGHESSSCCNHGSPTSTLTSLDHAPTKEHSSSKKKLSWTDSLPQASEQQSILCHGSSAEDEEGQVNKGISEEASLLLHQEQQEDGCKSLGEEDDGCSYYYLHGLLRSISGDGDEDAAEHSLLLESVTNSSGIGRSSCGRGMMGSSGVGGQDDCQINYSELLNEGDYEDCDWMLREVDADAIMETPPPLMF